MTALENGWLSHLRTLQYPHSHVNKICHWAIARVYDVCRLLRSHDHHLLPSQWLPTGKIMGEATFAYKLCKNCDKIEYESLKDHIA